MHHLSVSEVLQELETTLNGLNEKHAAERQALYGKNAFQEPPRPTIIGLFISQFQNLFVAILVIAALVTALLGDLKDTIVIMAIVFLNALLGLVQEYKAERAIEALKKAATPLAIVIRDGREQKINSEHIVPGDVVVLEQGTIVPADCRIIESASLQADESMLTGESSPIGKNRDPLPISTLVADRTNMCYKNTIITYGRGLGLVTATGMNTEIGKIASFVLEKPEKVTPLQKEIQATGKTITAIVFAILALIFFIGLLRQIPLLELFLLSVSLAVAAIPEGLPAILTITLAIGLQKMARQNAIVRKLPAVETLGATTVICTDKTGTLTKNEMTVTHVYTDQKLIHITGAGYDTRGSFLHKNRKYASESLTEVLTAGALCNNSHITPKPLGDPTEISLLVAAKKARLDISDYERVQENPFDAERKMMTVQVRPANRAGTRGKVFYTKGAFEEVIEKSTHYINQHGRRVKLTHDAITDFEAQHAEMASQALRVLAIARSSKLEQAMTLIGLVGMIDPPRPEVKDAIMKCRSAGIRVIMVTGDNPMTAKAIADQVGISSKEAIAGKDLMLMTDYELELKLRSVNVFARINPEGKHRIVSLLRDKGEVVAVTGDGVNDAPALKKAHIGVAMGISGTDVSKEASDMILVDDNFSTIVNAIETGRGVFDNIKKFVKYLLSANIGEVLTIFFALVANLPLPLTALHILWINLVTDGLPAVALGLDPPQSGIMERKPRKATDKVLSKLALQRLVVYGTAMALLGVFMFSQYLSDGAEFVHAQTAVFTFLVLFQMSLVFSIRNTTEPFYKGMFSNKLLLLGVGSSVVLQLLVVYNPTMQGFFGTAPLSISDWATISWFLLVGLAVMELYKLVAYRKQED